MTDSPAFGDAPEDASHQSSSPLSLSGLRDLLLRPSRFFRRTDLTKRPEVTFVAWLAGMAYCIDRVDRQLMKAELGTGSRVNAMIPVLTENWVAFWAFVVPVGALNAWIIWYLGGWWYRKRLNWSGAISPDPVLVRSVYTYQNMVWALPSIILVIGFSMTFESYAAAYRSDEWGSVVIMVLTIWSCFTSYFAATTAFTTSRARAALWFLVLPTALYTIALVAIGVLYAVLS